MAGVNAILSEVQQRLGGRTDIAARSLIWLNDAYMELLLSPRFSFFELDADDKTTVTEANTRVYSLAGIVDIWFILDVRDMTNERKLRKSSVFVYDARTWPHSDGQQPTTYARFGTDLEVDPTPGGAYQLRIRYRKRPPELVEGGSHLLGREWDEVLTALTVVKGYEALEMAEKAGAARALVEGLLGLREEPESLEDVDSDDTIGVRLEM